MKFSWLPCFNVGDQQTWVPEGFHPICGVDSLAKSNTTVRSHQAPSPHAPKCLISDCVWGFFTFLKYNSVFHYTLATTTGGKDLGLPIGYQKMTAWPNMFALLSLVGLGCCFLLFLFFSVLVWHTRSLPSISHGSKSTETSFIFFKKNEVKLKECLKSAPKTNATICCFCFTSPTRFTIFKLQAFSNLAGNQWDRQSSCICHRKCFLHWIITILEGDRTFLC